MSDRDILLAGPMATPDLLDALAVHGAAETLPGVLKGGAGAGIGGDWPAHQAGTGRIAAQRVQRTPELERYLSIVGLRPVTLEGREVWGLGTGAGSDWTLAHAPLMAQVALSVMSRPFEIPAERIAARLPRIAEIAWARMRLSDEPDPTACLPAPDRSRVDELSRHEAYGRYFSVDEIALRHRLHDGEWSGVLEREAFISADAALLLPYDPRRDQVLVISQFRVGPMVRGQAQCWMLEPVAGRIDAGETAADAARREAVEEAGLQVGRLYELPCHYPTPGAGSEFFYPFIGVADLADQLAGQGFGLSEEGEDISTHLMARSELTELALSGQLQCGPLILMALWLDRNADRIRAELSES